MLRLKELRGNKTQDYTAKQLGLTQRSYQNYESGSRQADYETLIKMAKYFNVSVDYLLGITDSVWTAEDYANGVQDTKKVSVTADQEEIFDKTNEVLELLGEKGKNLIIEFCDALIEKFGG